MFSDARKLAGAAARAPQRRCRLRAALPARQELRKAGVRHSSSEVDGARVAVVEQTALDEAVLPAATLQALQRSGADVVAELKRDPAVLVVAPLSGHHATLLRDTVRTLLDRPQGLRHRLDRRARRCPLDRGPVHARRLRRLHPRVHPPHRRRAPARDRGLSARGAGAGGGGADGGRRRAAAAQPHHDGRSDRHAPQPDAGQRLRHRPTAELVRDATCIHEVPVQLPGTGPPRLSGLPAARRLHRHEPGAAHRARTGTSTSTWCEGDLDDAEEHRRFYDEYNAVLDMPAEYYLDCIRIVFQQHLLPRGLWHVGGERVAPEAITRSALLTIEGRAGRHLGPRPDAGGARPLHRHPRRAQAPPDGRGRRPLRHLQRPALARDRLSAGARLHRGG